LQKKQELGKFFDVQKKETFSKNKIQAKNFFKRTQYLWLFKFCRESTLSKSNSQKGVISTVQTEKEHDGKILRYFILPYFLRYGKKK